MGQGRKRSDRPARPSSDSSARTSTARHEAVNLDAVINDVGVDPEALLQLQRAAGNAAVTSLLTDSVQRDGPSTDAPTRRRRKHRKHRKRRKRHQKPKDQTKTSLPDPLELALEANSLYVASMDGKNAAVQAAVEAFRDKLAGDLYARLGQVAQQAARAGVMKSARKGAKGAANIGARKALRSYKRERETSEPKTALERYQHAQGDAWMQNPEQAREDVAKRITEIAALKGAEEATKDLGALPSSMSLLHSSLKTAIGLDASAQKVAQSEAGRIIDELRVEAAAVQKIARDKDAPKQDLHRAQEHLASVLALSETLPTTVTSHTINDPEALAAATKAARKTYMQCVVLAKEYGTKQGQSEELREAAALAAQNIAGDKETGKTAVSQIVEGPASSSLAKVAGIIDVACPNKGDEVSLDVTLKIPIPAAPGVFLGLRLHGEADRGDEDEVGVRLEAGVLGGYGVEGLWEGALEFGGWLEAKGKDAAECMTVMSYVLFRRFRESYIPREVENALWGMGGKSGRSKWEEAELWAAAVEETAFAPEDSKAQGGSGLYGKAELSVGDTDTFGGGEFGLKGISGKQYTPKTIGARKKLGTTEAEPAVRGPRPSLGRRIGGVEFTGEASLGGFGSLETSIAVQWARERIPGRPKSSQKRQTKLVSVEIEGAASLEGSAIFLKEGAKPVQELVTLLATAGASLHGLITHARDVVAKSEEDQKVSPGPLVGSFADVGSTAAKIGTLGAGLTDEVLGDVLSLSSALKLQLSLAYDEEDGGTITVSLRSVDSLELSAGVFGVEAERSRRIVAFEWSKEGFKVL